METRQKTIHTFREKRVYKPSWAVNSYPGREVTFEITLDVEALLTDRGARALASKDRQTTVCDGSIVIKVLDVVEG